MVRHPGRLEYVKGADEHKRVFSQGLLWHSNRPDWVIDGILYDRTLRRSIMERADQIVYLKVPLRTSELWVFKRRLRRGKRITPEFVRRRARKAREHPRHKERLEADLETHAAKTVSLRTHREIDRYLRQLRAQLGKE